MKHRKKKKGASLIIVLMVLAVAMIFSSVTLTTISKTTKANAQEKKSEDLLYAAESGLQYGVAYFNSKKNNIGLLTLNENVLTVDKSEINNSNVVVKISEYKDTSKNEEGYEIRSEAISKEDIAKKRIAVIKIKKTKTPVNGGGDNGQGINKNIDEAVYASNSIKFSEGAKVTGDIAVGSSQPGAITGTGGPTIERGVVKIPSGASNNVLVWPKSDKPDPQIEKSAIINKYQLVKIPKFPEGLTNQVNIVTAWNNSNPQIKEDSVYDSITIQSNYSAYINATKDTIIRIKTLNISQGHLNIVGNGKVILYIDNLVQVNGSIGKEPIGTITVRDPKNLVIYCGNSGGTYTVNGSTEINGSFYFENENLNITAGGKIYGVLYTSGGKIDISGGTKTQLVYAPNANINIFQGGDISGAVVGKNVNLSGGIGITFTKPTIELETGEPKPPQIVESFELVKESLEYPK